ncbi:MAG: DUF4340 domain-containing protein [Deltaproteobacteria bacterium]|nr:MAG: DUF4340 domain-containing protein [Deltaproteobacteria bacterium]
MGAVLVLVVRAPVQRTGLYALRGHRVFGVPRGAVRGIEVVMGGRRFSARRLDHGWEIDGRGANPGTGDALEDLVETVARLRAVDVFRPKDGTSYGLEQPRGTITVTTARAVRRLLLGDSNTAGSALYAHRGEDPRVIQVGTLLLSEIERVFYHRDRPEPPRARAPFLSRACPSTTSRRSSGTATSPSSASGRPSPSSSRPRCCGPTRSVPRSNTLSGRSRRPPGPRAGAARAVGGPRQRAVAMTIAVAERRVHMKTSAVGMRRHARRLTRPL